MRRECYTALPIVSTEIPTGKTITIALGTKGRHEIISVVLFLGVHKSIYFCVYEIS